LLLSMLVGPLGMAGCPPRYSAKAMPALPPELRQLVQSGPMAHLSTINSDGSPQVTVIWVGLDGDELVSTHMRENVKLGNIRRDPRVALSFDAPREPGVWINPYAVVYARATVEPSGRIWELMARHAKVYVSSDAELPVPEGAEPGFIVRYAITRIGGVGPWATGAAP
jgi:PPOX class probable F420-dependent enzyme